MPQPLAHRQFQRVPLAARAEFLANIAHSEQRTILYVAANEKECVELTALAQFHVPSLPVMHFPAWDVLPYDRVSPSQEIISARLQVLKKLLETPEIPRLVLCGAACLQQRLPPKEAINAKAFTVMQRAPLNRDALMQFLTDHHYQRMSKVVDMGEFSVRGGIIDIFPSGHTQPIRIDCFGDEVESIRAFDPLTQLSANALETITLQPLHDLNFSDAMIARFRARYRELFSAITKEDTLYATISEGRPIAGMEHWTPLFYDHMHTLLDYLPGAIIAQDAQLNLWLSEHFTLIEEYYAARKNPVVQRHSHYHPLPPDALYVPAHEMLAACARQERITLSAFDQAGAKALPYTAPLPITQRVSMPPFEALREFLATANMPVLFACNSAGSADRIAAMLQAEGVASTQVQHAHECEQHRSMHIYMAVLPVHQGYSSPFLHIITEHHYLGDRAVRIRKARKKSDVFLQEAGQFTPGELMVHREHGIGRFDGLVTVEVGTTKHDCVKLIYDGDDRLFVPVENLELISRFGDDIGDTALDKLGGVAWQKRKSGLKKRLRMAASELLKIAAARLTQTAPELHANSAAYENFCANFPYSETEDQLSAIEDVLADMASGKSMDRLICGDVGFGKTEVALRAAFVAANHGYQVAIIAPTTLLARQHFNTFVTRFAGTHLQVRMLSRLASSADMSTTKEGLKTGAVHIVIGTHALLADGLEFAKLGLLVVDEEQHFGVKQKEKIKRLKRDVHVLTLSATPIPRTLQLALAGVRELSLITTPPIDRMAVRTSVLPFDALTVREAILREYHRGGRSFYVTPRIQYMADLEQKLRDLVPEIRIISAHGQMPASQLDRVMNDFYDGQYDVLLSTAIIESGIDIPTANTMLIDHPEMFGLSQLYQLRGRVGRSNVRAYAYFLLPERKMLTPQATRRLEVMQQLDHLGAGFSIASHDMDIRGYGNILGEEQSGHIKEVGVELYQAMLEEAIMELKARKMPEEASVDHDWSPQINVGLSVQIPESYITDLGLRLNLYRRAANLATLEQVDDFGVELVDRFGPMPEEMAHLLDIMRIKIACKHAGIAKLDAGEKAMLLSFHKNQFVNPEGLLTLIATSPARFKLRADQKLLVQEATAPSVERLQRAMAIAAEIGALVREQGQRTAA